MEGPVSNAVVSATLVEGGVLVTFENGMVALFSDEELTEVIGRQPSRSRHLPMNH